MARFLKPTAGADDVAEFIAQATLDSAKPLRTAATHCSNSPISFTFACHGDTHGLMPGDYRIRIQGQRGGARWVTLGQLRIGMTQHYGRMPGSRRAAAAPGCGDELVRLGTSGSSYRGIVSTTCFLLPASVASSDRRRSFLMTWRPTFPASSMPP